MGRTAIKDQRQGVMKDYRTHDTDSGSPEVQVAVLTTRIKHLTEHMKVHKKDYHSRRGLLQKVGRRSKLLKYLGRTAPERFQAITEKLGIRR